MTGCCLHDPVQENGQDTAENNQHGIRMDGAEGVRFPGGGRGEQPAERAQFLSRDGGRAGDILGTFASDTSHIDGRDFFDLIGETAGRADGMPGRWTIGHGYLNPQLNARMPMATGSHQ